MKVLVVTGGGRGIGAATARLAAHSGYRVCVNYRKERTRPKRWREEIGGLAMQATSPPRRTWCASSKRWMKSSGG